MTRSELIASYANGANLIREALKDIPVEALDFKPSPTAWSIREIVHHMPDSEASSYVRARKIIAQSGATVDVYDQDAWAESLFSGKRNLDLSLGLFDLMRKSTAELVTLVDESVWENNFVMHPDDGKLTLGHWLEIYERHVTKHVGQIRRTFEVWRAGRTRQG
jgi:hypothetical protein